MQFCIITITYKMYHLFILIKDMKNIGRYLLVYCLLIFFSKMSEKEIK
jgi:hypothetical protein